MSASGSVRSAARGQIDRGEDEDPRRADQKAIAVGAADVRVVLGLAAACLLSIDDPAELASLTIEQLAERVNAIPFETEELQAWRSLFRTWSDTQHSIEPGDGGNGKAGGPLRLR